MIPASNISANLEYRLNNYPSDDDLYHVVVQKGNVGSKYVYALQLLHSGHNIYVFRGNRQTDVNFDKSNPVLRLIGQDGNTAGGHTQTWEYANQSGDWFVGTKPSTTDEPYWDRQIARVHIPNYNKIYYNTDLPRLSYLNRGGSQQGINYAGADMLRAEAAVSPDYQYFMLATVDRNPSDSSKGYNGYFSIYNLSDINSALNAAGTNDVNIQNIRCVKAFMIPDFVGKIGSIQGYDIDNGANYIYVSSQKAGDTERKIVKIPWESTDPSNWERVDLTYNSTLDEDAAGYYTELEGIQLIDENDLYLTVAYHRDSDKLTAMNRIYRVSWTSNI
ncbi:helveticin J family class III bacteriocin [Lactobacillus helveticus]